MPAHLRGIVWYLKMRQVRPIGFTALGSVLATCLHRAPHWRHGVDVQQQSNESIHRNRGEGSAFCPHSTCDEPRGEDREADAQP
jgi:hypothetical protein